MNNANGDLENSIATQIFKFGLKSFLEKEFPFDTRFLVPNILGSKIYFLPKFFLTKIFLTNFFLTDTFMDHNFFQRRFLLPKLFVQLNNLWTLKSKFCWHEIFFTQELVWNQKNLNDVSCFLGSKVCWI